MELNFFRADPVGNVTIIVTTEIPSKIRATVASKLLERDSKAEQVGFWTSPIYGGEFRIEMMGNEFCGNAFRCAALIYAKNHNCNIVRGEISGYDRTLTASVNLENNMVWLNMPQARITKKEYGNLVLPCVEFPGIMHFIHTSQTFIPKDRETFQKLSSKYDSPSVGLMIYNNIDESIEPFVYVAATDTLYRENSCASGTAAVTAYLKRDHDFKEPGGILSSKYLPLSIGSVITLKQEEKIDVIL